MKIGLSNEEAEILRKIAAKVDLTIKINEKNIVDVPNAIVGLKEAYDMLRHVPKFVAKKFVEQNRKWFNLLGLR